ncbi:MAG: hypothetical protein SNG10_02470, partial [Rikenellaceae bacterium]
VNDFFKGGNNLPWWAVSLSIIATKTSVATFIAVPAFVFSATGDMSYIQMTIGFILGNLLFVFVLLKEYYEENIYSPYDFIQNRLGKSVSQLARLFFMLGATLSQGVRLVGTGLVLSVITGLDSLHCIVIVAMFAVAWSYIGGIATVVWTDVIQFVIFISGALFALYFAMGGVPGGFGEIIAIADAKAKLVLLDLSMDPTKTYTLWVGILGSTFFEFGSDAIDQVTTQRALCCKDIKEARKAVAFSAVGAATTWIMLLVGLSLVAFYHINPLPADVAAAMTTEPDKVFPYFVMTQLPDGVSGLIIAAMFAAGISTLDSALAALSQTSVMGVAPLIFPRMKEFSDRKIVRISKWAIVGWGMVLTLLGCFFSTTQSQGLLSLGFKMPGYVYGILIGIAFLSLMRKGRFGAILVGSICSVSFILWLNSVGVSSFWWYPMGAIIVMAVTLADHYFIVKRG